MVSINVTKSNITKLAEFEFALKLSKIEEKDKIMENSYVMIEIKALNFQCFLL